MKPICEMKATTNGRYSPIGTWNSIIKKNGKNYRERVECMIFNSEGQVLLATLKENSIRERYTKYILPGGSTEKGKSMEAQVKAECQQEVHINIKNIRYVLQYDYKITKEHASKFEKYMPGINYYGISNNMFIADYDSKYTGYVKKADRDGGMLQMAKWYDINEVYDELSPQQKKCVDEYLDTHELHMEPKKESAYLDNE